MAKIVISRDMVRDLDFSAPHIERLKRLSAGVAPRPDSFEGISARLAMARHSDDSDFKRAVKKTWQQAVATTMACLSNGAGMPADAALREFAVNYNDRMLRFGAHYLPSSFNIVEAFLRSNDLYTVFRMRPEINHVVDFGDFLDYITRPGPSLLQSQIGEMPQGVIHNYSFLNGACHWSIGEPGARYGFSSVSLIRFGNDLTVFAQAGFEADLAAAQINIRSKVVSPNADKPGLVPAPSLERRAVALDGREDFWRTFLAVRIDLFTFTLSSRYRFKDMGDMWDFVSDDPITTGRMPADKELAEMNAQLDTLSGAFGVLANMALLPRMFQEHAEDVSDEIAHTQLRDDRSGRGGNFVAKHSIKDQIVYEQPVRALSAISSRRIDGVALPEYALSIEVKGFWKPLPFGQFGVDQNGHRILGRTWVQQTETFKSGTLTSPAQDAKKDEINSSEDSGTIYVARNASHQIDVFKIGLTRRAASVRMKELSSPTGVPDKFLVAQEWRVRNVSVAEKRIHDLLKEYRLTDSREFFRAPYQKIREVIDIVITELGGGE